MKKILYGILLLNFMYACTPKTGDSLSNTEPPATEKPISSSLDLTKVDNDRVWVEIDPGSFSKDTVIFRLPRVVQGTYDVSDFGSFVEDFVAYDYSGAPIAFKKIDTNSWEIPNARQLDKLGYYVNDTFDIEGTDKPTPFSPSGTNIEPTNYVLNLHGFIGYFDGMYDSDYSIDITAPADFKKSSALSLTGTTTSEDGSSVTDTYFADRYFELTDNPMMYGDLEITEFPVGDINIVLSMYSPTGAHTAQQQKETLETMMDAQKRYLGDLNSTPRYDVFLYLATRDEGEPQGMGALEHHRSTVVVLPEFYPEDALDEVMTDVVSHEFFHIVTPLTVHSEDVHYFDYDQPTFSKHLWMYEGVTEYFASHFQVYEGLQSREEFYDKLMEKIQTSLTLDDAMSFTEMSENILEEPYASNYYNVYQKGALIGMCIDILMREESGGTRSMLSLMKELSAKYGMDKPFVDDDIIEEITEMTYPSVGEFLQTHVVGSTPINYEEFFSKVGLEYGEKLGESTFFHSGQAFYVAVNEEGGVYFRDDMELNTSLIELGIEGGDVIKSINGTDYTVENINDLIPETMGWTPDQEIEMVVTRGGEEVSVSGVVGTPMVNKPGIIESEDATDAQLNLRDQWLGSN